MSKMSDMTEYHASAYRLPSGFEHCSKLKPVAEAATALDRVKAVVDVLYSPGGCPWDGKQTNKSLLKNLLEETYEYVDAVETHDRDNMREELGDVLLQSVVQARVCEADTEDPFGIDEVADRLENKLIHVILDCVPNVGLTAAHTEQLTRELFHAFVQNQEAVNILFSGARQGIYAKCIEKGLRDRLAAKDPTFAAAPARGILLSFCVQGCFYAFANNSGQMDVEHLVDLLAVIAKAAQSLNR